jgi:hypothetical protein
VVTDLGSSKINLMAVAASAGFQKYPVEKENVK